MLTQNERTQVYGFGKSVAQKARWKAQKVLTLGNGNATIGLKIQQFKDDLHNGKINISVDNKSQPKHIVGKGWRNQVKQAIASGKGVPRSRLAKGLAPQELVDKYAGKGDSYTFRANQKYPDEYITLPFIAGRTYNRKTGKYESTHRIQIKYDENKGAHVFPILER